MGGAVTSCCTGLFVEECGDELLFGGPEQRHDALVDRILVLVEPAVDVVSHLHPRHPNSTLKNLACSKVVQYRVNSFCTHHSSIVTQFEVLLELGFLVWTRFAEGGGFAVVVLVQFRQERLVGGFREHTLLLQDRQDAHGLQKSEKAAVKCADCSERILSC